MNVLITNPVLKVGDVVTWRVPMAGESPDERYVVTESNGDRGFMRYVCDLPIPPVMPYHAGDVVKVEMMECP